MPLFKNPDKRKNDVAFIRNGIITDKKKNYSKKTIKNMSFCPEDFSKVKGKIRNFKKRQKKKQAANVSKLTTYAACLTVI